MQNALAIYPISAQPPTLGHGNILRRAAACFVKLYWVAALSPEKETRLSLQSQIEIMQDYVKYYKLNNVEVAYFSGSIARYALEKEARFIVRGVRHGGDLDHEMSLSAGYRGITEEVEVVAFFADPKYSRISSSLVRELARIGEDISAYVIPATVGKILTAYGPVSFEDKLK